MLVAMRYCTEYKLVKSVYRITLIACFVYCNEMTAFSFTWSVFVGFGANVLELSVICIWSLLSGRD